MQFSKRSSSNRDGKWKFETMDQKNSSNGLETFHLEQTQYTTDTMSTVTCTCSKKEDYMVTSNVEGNQIWCSVVVAWRIEEQVAGDISVSSGCSYEDRRPVWIHTDVDYLKQYPQNKLLIIFKATKDPESERHIISQTGGRDVH